MCVNSDLVNSFEVSNNNIILFLILQPLTDELFQLDGVGSKLSDSLRKLLDSHLIFVVLPTELLLVHAHLLKVLSLSCEEERGRGGGREGEGGREREREGGRRERG